MRENKRIRNGRRPVDKTGHHSPGREGGGAVPAATGAASDGRVARDGARR